MARKTAKERRDIHAEITERIVKELEAGTIPWLKPWTSKNGGGYVGMPRNAITHRRYSGVNVLLLWISSEAHGFQSTEWLTYKQAVAAGGHVRQGEKGTTIVFMKPFTVNVTGENGESSEQKRMVAKAYTVFNVEQCEGLKLKVRAVDNFTPEATVDGRSSTFVKAVAETAIRIEHGGHSAYYSPALDCIQMPLLENFRQSADYDATLAHELIHATGHKSRLNRFDEARTRKNYAFEELVAELGAAFTCAEFGIVGDIRHASYIASWIKLLKDDPRAMMSAASKASKAVEFLYPQSAEQADDEIEMAA